MRYYSIWIQLAKNSFASFLANPINSLGYFLGKIVRFAFLYAFIVSIFRVNNTLVGYSGAQTLLIFLVFNILDIITQALFRGVYIFPGQVRRGQLDSILCRPVNPIFYILSQRTDPLDLALLPPLLILTVIVGLRAHLELSFFILLCTAIISFASLLILLGFHILSMAMSVRKDTGDSAIWMYRDLMRFSVFPPEIFSTGLRFIFTFIIPIMAIVAFPAKALFGALSLWHGLYFCFFAIGFFSLSVLLWERTLKRYASASN